MQSPFLIAVLLFVYLPNTFGQIRGDSIPSNLPLVDNESVRALRAAPTVSFEEIRDRKGWKPYDSTFITNSETAIWLKFSIVNPSTDTVHDYLYSNEQYTSLYHPTPQGVERLANGLLVPLSKRANRSEFFFTQLSLMPLQTSVFYIRLFRNNSRFVPDYPSLYPKKEYLELSQIMHKEEAPSIAFIYFYITALITICSFALVFWIRIPKKLYLYYLCYLFFQIIYGFQVLANTSASTGNLFVSIPKLSHSFLEPIQFIFIGFYILFILHLLDVKSYDKLLGKWMYYLGIFCFAYAIFRFILAVFLSDLALGEVIFTAVRLFVLPLNLVLILWIIYKVKHPLLIYFIVGQSFFFVAALFASYLGYSGLHFDPQSFFNFPEAPNIVFQMGLLAEVFCFSLALGENFLLLQKEKNKANEALINQFHRNRMLQKKMNAELDKKVNEKTDELIQVYSQIEKENEKRIKEAFTQKLKEMEMMALRSQMNPHFLFNSLNAIKHLIMTSHNDRAIAYLDDFSSLLRGILQNSNREIVTVEEELEILELYLSLEKIRMGRDFDYHVEVDSLEELSQYHIPPLLLQPFAENAIWHGLGPSDRRKKKLLIIFDTSDNLKITIEDNGIGRKASQNKKRLHKSRSMDITKERITLYNHLHEPSIHLSIIDIEEDDYALGTRIILTYTH